MNVYDSERMADVLAPLGYGLTDSADGADMVILNTCHIREKARKRSIPISAVSGPCSRPRQTAAGG